MSAESVRGQHSCGPRDRRLRRGAARSLVPRGLHGARAELSAEATVTVQRSVPCHLDFTGLHVVNACPWCINDTDTHDYSKHALKLCIRINAPRA